MDLFHYLPYLILAAVIGIVLLFGFLFIREIIRGQKGEATCMYCKAAAPKASNHSYLFLIPVYFGDKYGDAENYLRTHMRPIMENRQIPTGQRACRIELYRCSRCDKKQVDITDFLQVRGADYIKGIYMFAYEPFRHLLEEWDNMANNM